MTQLAAHDLNDILTVGRTALECDNLDDLQEQTFRLMEDCVGATSAVYLGVTGKNSAWQFESGLAYGVPNEGLKVWCANYQDMDPFVARLLEKPVNDSTVVLSTDVMPHAELVRSRFYQEFLQPHFVYHVMVVALVKNSRPIGLFGFHRTAGMPAFSKREATKADLLSPYLSAAVQKIQASDKASERELIVEKLAINVSHTGVVILDANGSLICDYGNAADILQFQNSRSSGTGPPELPGEITERCDRVRRALARRHSTDFHERFDIEQPGGELINVHLHPYDCGAKGLRFMVYLGIGQTDVVRPDQLARYELTPRQIDIVKLVSLGMTNPEIADQLCISSRTVQNHLRSIYMKVNVRNRTSLVSTLAGQQ